MAKDHARQISHLLHNCKYQAALWRKKAPITRGSMLRMRSPASSTKRYSRRDPFYANSHLNWVAQKNRNISPTICIDIFGTKRPRVISTIMFIYNLRHKKSCAGFPSSLLTTPDEILNKRYVSFSFGILERENL